MTKSRDEFSAARAKCENEIAELQSVIDSIDKQRERPSKQQELVAEITEAMNALMNGVDKVVYDKKTEHLDFFFYLAPHTERKKPGTLSRNISEASVPISVRIPVTSL